MSVLLLLLLLFGSMIGFTAARNGVDEPYYVQVGGVLWAIILTVPIHITFKILI